MADIGTGINKQAKALANKLDECGVFDQDRDAYVLDWSKALPIITEALGTLEQEKQVRLDELKRTVAIAMKLACPDSDCSYSALYRPAYQRSDDRVGTDRHRA